jgi:hypothetical protein
MVFISHSSEDRSTADAICAHLESAGINCWVAPRDIEPGVTWTKGIMQGLEACRVLILVFSEHANDSDHVEREVAKAFSSGLAVIPFRIKDVLPNQSLSYFLDTVQWLEASAPPLDKHLGALCERVKKLLGNETTRQPPKRSGPEKISIARLPVTGRDVFGREEDIAFLDAAWANQDVNVVGQSQFSIRSRSAKKAGSVRLSPSSAAALEGPAFNKPLCRSSSRRTKAPARDAGLERGPACAAVPFRSPRRLGLDCRPVAAGYS